MQHSQEHFDLPGLPQTKRPRADLDGCDISQNKADHPAITESIAW